MLLAKKSKTQDIMSISIPPDEVILTKAYKLVVDKEIRIVDLVNVILKDPAITLKILKTGNQSATLNGQQETISLSSAITRLGFDSLKSILFGLQAIKNPKVKNDNRPISIYLKSISISYINIIFILKCFSRNEYKEKEDKNILLFIILFI